MSQEGKGEAAGKAPKHLLANAGSAHGIANVFLCDLGKS